LFMSLCDKDGNAGLNLQEFTDFCESQLLVEEGASDMAYIHQMIKGFVQKMAREKAQLVEMWHYRAERVDFYARRIFPISYFVILFVVWLMGAEDFSNAFAPTDKKAKEL